MKNYCVDCGKKLSRTNAQRCKSCSKKGKRNSNFKDGQSLKHNYCINCGKLLKSYTAKRCPKCAGKQHSKKISGKNNHNFIDGRCSKTYYCIDCGKDIAYTTWKYRKRRCQSCAKKEKNHPLFGKHHTKATKKKQSKARIGKFKGKNSPRFGKIASHGKGGYYNNIYMRSSYEVAFAFFLNCNGIKWEYEPKTFDLGDTTYTPDFYLPKWNLYIEIKGWWRDDAKYKYDKFKKTYPNENIKVLMQKELEEMGVL